MIETQKPRHAAQIIIGFFLMLCHQGTLFADVVSMISVDAFETDNIGVATSDGLQNGSHLAAEALGGARGIDVFNDIGGNGVTSVAFSGGTMNFMNDPGEFGSVEVIYEREAGGGLFVDVTNAGMNDLFSFDVVSSNSADFRYGLEVVDFLGRRHREMIGDTLAGETGYIPLSHFASLTLQNVRSVEFIVEDPGAGGAVSIDNLSFIAVPEPTPFVLVAVSGLVFCLRRSDRISAIAREC